MYIHESETEELNGRQTILEDSRTIVLNKSKEELSGGVSSSFRIVKTKHINDQYPTIRGGGGGGYSLTFSTGVCR